MFLCRGDDQRLAHRRGGRLRRRRMPLARLCYFALGRAALSWCENTVHHAAGPGGAVLVAETLARGQRRRAMVDPASVCALGKPTRRLRRGIAAVGPCHRRQRGCQMAGGPADCLFHL